MPASFRTPALILLLALPPLPLAGQLLDRGPMVLELPASTRAAALGNTFALGFRDSDALFYQPALLDRAQGMAGSLQRFDENGTLVTFSGATDWFGGGVALGVQHLSYESPLTAPFTGPDLLGLSADEGDLRDEGFTAASETVLSVGYGRTLKGIRMGVVGKLLEQRLGHRKAGTMAADLGVAASPGVVTLGLAVQNLGPDLSFKGEEIPLPTRFTLGASSQAAPVGPLDISASTGVSYRLDGDVVPSVGLEVAYWPVSGRTFVGRIGYRERSDDFSADPISFGMAFLGDAIILEYTYQGFDAGNPSHRFGLGWR